MSGSYHNAKNGRVPFELGAFDLDGTVLRRDVRDVLLAKSAEGAGDARDPRG